MISGEMKAETIPDQRDQLLCTTAKKNPKNRNNFYKKKLFQYRGIKWVSCFVVVHICLLFHHVYFIRNLILKLYVYEKD